MKGIISRLYILFSVLVVLLVAGTVGFMTLEGLSLADAIYFTIVTITTVGYGDIYPVTTGGRILAVILIIIGVGTFLGIVADITQLLVNRRQETIRKEHINILISVFFSEIGTRLMEIFTGFDPCIEPICREFREKKEWSDKNFVRLYNLIQSHQYSIDYKLIKLELLRDFFVKKSDLLVRLLENPSLRENESFTELLRAVFHLKDEITLRPGEISLTDADLEHLADDSKWAYAMLANQWVKYMQYLQTNYPYLFSLALRINPFSRRPFPIVEQ